MIARQRYAGWMVGCALCAALVLWGCKPEMMSTGGGTEDRDPKPTSTDFAKEPLVPFRLLSVNFTNAEGPPSPRSPSLEQTKTQFEEALLQEPEFVRAKSKGRKGASSASVKASFRADYEDAKDGSGQILGAVFLEVFIQTRNAKGKRLERYSTSAFVGEALEGKDSDAALVALVSTVSKEVAQNLSKQIRAEFADDKTLLGFLDSDKDVAMLVPALQQIRTRKLRRAAPKVQELLQHPERDVVNVAASALGNIGDRKSVPALITCGSRVEAQDRLPVLYALGEIGGPEAILYLETLVKNINHPAVQSAAENALQRARRER